MIIPFGSATRDMTPPIGGTLAGFAALREPSTDVELPLRIAAMAFGEGEESAIIVSAEIVGFYELAPALREAIALQSGLPVRSIALVSTHTHAGPTIREMDRRMKGPLNEEYITQFKQNVVDAALASLAARKPCRLTFCSEPFPLAVNRRRPDGKGGVLWGPWPDGPSDPMLSLITANDASSGELVGLLFSYACHPTSRVTRRIGGDYVGFTYRALDRRFPGATIAFLQGCAGEQKPDFKTEDGYCFRHASSEEIEAVGERMADALEAIIRKGKGQPIAAPLTATRSILIELTLNHPSCELLQKFKESPNATERAWAKKHPETINSSPPPTPIPMEAQFFLFGHALALVFMAGEIGVGHGLALRRRLGECYGAVIPIGYANAMVGYVPTSDQIAEGGYEVWGARQNHNRAGFFSNAISQEVEETITNAICAATSPLS